MDWFPKLPSYAAFSRRLNFLAPAFQALAEEWLTVILKKEVENTTYIVDSCPVILAKGPRSGYAKVAGELCAKSYNSSRKEWYYGVKLHAFVARKPGRLPAPMGLFLSGAAVHDLESIPKLTMNANKLTPDNNSAGKLKQGHIVDSFLFVSNQEFTETVEKRVSNLNNPSASAKVGVAF